MQLSSESTAQSQLIKFHNKRAVNIKRLDLHNFQQAWYFLAMEHMKLGCCLILGAKLKHSIYKNGVEAICILTAIETKTLNQQPSVKLQ